MLELRDKDFKTSNISMFKDLKEICILWENRWRILAEKVEVFFKKEILELKSTYLKWNINQRV